MQVNNTALIQIMAFRLAGAKPLSEPMLDYCYLDHWDQTSVKILSEIYTIFKKMHLKMSAKWQPFCLNLNLLSKDPGLCSPLFICMYTAPRANTWVHHVMTGRFWLFLYSFLAVATSSIDGFICSSTHPSVCGSVCLSLSLSPLPFKNVCLFGSSWNLHHTFTLWNAGGMYVFGSEC